MIYALPMYLLIIYVVITYIIGILTGIFTVKNNPKTNVWSIFVFIIFSPITMPIALYIAYKINKNKNNEVL